jgi:biopolymer transport protein ExbD
MPRHRRQRSGALDMDMTPMIDVVFQLIIFFIVTVVMQQEFNEEIQLEMAPHGPVIAESHPTTLVIEVDKRGWVSIHNAPLRRSQLERIVKGRYNRYGEFPVLIRGDKETRHQDIRKVMDICTGIGIWRISFVAIKEEAPRS